MTRYLTLLSVCFSMLLLGACESLPHLTQQKAATPQLVAAPDSVSAMLADAADRTASALENLAAVEQYRTPDVAVEPINDAPLHLQSPVSVNWTGPVEPLADAVADRVGYRFATLGAAPAIPIVVSIDVTAKPAIEVFRDMGLQMGRRADIRVDSSRGLVEIQYAPVGSMANLGPVSATEN